MNYIIPVHNEVLHLPILLRTVFLYDEEASVCIVNSASTDGSMALAAKYPVEIIHSPKGYTEALAKGYQYAVAKNWESLIQLDGDGQHHPMYAKRLEKQLHHADWVIASRNNTGSIGMRGVRYASWLGSHFLLNRSLHDPSSGYWALNKKAIHSFADIFPVPFTEIPLRILMQQSLCIQEVLVPMEERTAGVSMNAGWKGIIHGFHMLYSGWKTKKKWQK